MNIPYTYLIGWKNLNKYYYGVRYSFNCHPSDLFVTYFTSSSVVKSYIDIYGNPDIIQIRKTFKNKDAACKWESKVLKRLNAVNRLDFLNKTDRPAPPIITSEIMSNTLVTLKGDLRSPKQKASAFAHSIKMSGRKSKKSKQITILGETYDSITSAMKQLNISFSVITFIRNNDISNFSDIESIKAHIWNERSLKLKLKVHSEETKEKLRLANIGKIGTRIGLTNSPETREKISKALTGKKSNIIICPHCNKNGGINTMKRWHFDNCKYKDNVSSKDT
jgi:hypothetical protein